MCSLEIIRNVFFFLVQRSSMLKEEAAAVMDGAQAVVVVDGNQAVAVDGAQVVSSLFVIINGIQIKDLFF